MAEGNKYEQRKPQLPSDVKPLDMKCGDGGQFIIDLLSVSSHQEYAYRWHIGTANMVTKVFAIDFWFSLNNWLSIPILFAPQKSHSQKAHWCSEEGEHGQNRRLGGGLTDAETTERVAKRRHLPGQRAYGKVTDEAEQTQLNRTDYINVVEN